MDINLIVKISARAWGWRILAVMHQGVPGRQATLLAATCAGRTAFAQSLNHLIALGLLERNPGHGHPLRPEFRLTPQGTAAAAMASQIEATVPGSTQNPLMRRAWSLPVLSISHTPRSFTELSATLRPITDRALSQSLKALESGRWIHRVRETPDQHRLGQYQAFGDGKRISLAASTQR